MRQEGLKWNITGPLDSDGYRLLAPKHICTGQSPAGALECYSRLRWRLNARNYVTYIQNHLCAHSIGSEQYLGQVDQELGLNRDMQV